MSSTAAQSLGTLHDGPVLASPPGPAGPESPPEEPLADPLEDPLAEPLELPVLAASGFDIEPESGFDIESEWSGAPEVPPLDPLAASPAETGASLPPSVRAPDAPPFDELHAALSATRAAIDRRSAKEEGRRLSIMQPRLAGSMPRRKLGVPDRSVHGDRHVSRHIPGHW
jgi:hypothetical protein